MHTEVQLVPDSLDVVRAVWNGTLGAYPDVGDWTPPNWVFRDVDPAEFAARAIGWVSHGATIVGGCCGIGPEHIAALAGASGQSLPSATNGTSSVTRSIRRSAGRRCRPARCGPHGACP